MKTKSMRLLCCLILLFSLKLNGFISGHQAVSNNHLTKGFHELDLRYYELAITEIERENWEDAESYLEQITSLKRKPEYIQTYLKVLFRLGKTSAVIDFVDDFSNREKVLYYDSVIEKYILSSLELERVDSIAELIELQRKYFPQRIHNTYKELLYSLLISGRAEQTIALIEIFPNHIYLEGEKNLILGIAHYQLGFLRSAAGFFSKAIDKGDERLCTSLFGFLSLIAYRLQDPDLIANHYSRMESDCGRMNSILLLLEQKMTDEATLLALHIENPVYKSLISLFLAWEAGHYRTAKTILESIDSALLDEYTLLLLLNAETLFHNGEYREAESIFKRYIAKPSSDTKYANHSIAHSFKGFYRYNSTAYYWLKNLETEKSVYDSLASNNLAKLYHFTQNYATALVYFNYHFDKYQVNLEDHELVNPYLNTLYHLNRIGTLADRLEEFSAYVSDLDKFRYYKAIARGLSKRGKEEEAVSYYKMALELSFQSELALEMERLKFRMGVYKDSEDFILSVIEKYPDNVQNSRFAIDLAKYYLNQNRYDSALEFISSFLERNETMAVNDSLSFFLGLTEKELVNDYNALKVFRSLVEDNTDVRTQSLQQIETILMEWEARKSIDYLIGVIENSGYTAARYDFLKILATIYESNNLYREANEIYLSLLGEYSIANVSELCYLIAVNEIYQKKYRSALSYLDIVMKQEEVSYHFDSLFLAYLAHYSLNEHNKALQILIDLYYSFPKAPQRFEVVRNLIERFMEREQYIFAWHFLKDYYPKTNRSQRFIFDRFHSLLAEELQSDTLTVHQIVDYRTIIENNLTLWEQYEN